MKIGIVGCAGRMGRMVTAEVLGTDGRVRGVFWITRRGSGRLTARQWYGSSGPQTDVYGPP